MKRGADVVFRVSKGTAGVRFRTWALQRSDPAQSHVVGGKRSPAILPQRGKRLDSLQDKTDNLAVPGGRYDAARKGGVSSRFLRRALAVQPLRTSLSRPPYGSDPRESHSSLKVPSAILMLAG